MVKKKRDRENGRGDWGEGKEMPAIRNPFCSFVRLLAALKFRLAQRQFMSNLIIKCLNFRISKLSHEIFHFDITCT